VHESCLLGLCTASVEVVSSWLGSTPAMVMRHYLLTTAQHFDLAVEGDASAHVNEAAQQARV
jgi:hypothetical protein